MILRLGVAQAEARRLVIPRHDVRHAVGIAPLIVTRAAIASTSLAPAWLSARPSGKNTAHAAAMAIVMRSRAWTAGTSGGLNDASDAATDRRRRRARRVDLQIETAHLTRGNRERAVREIAAGRGARRNHADAPLSRRQIGAAEEAAAVGRRRCFDTPASFSNTTSALSRGRPSSLLDRADDVPDRERQRRRERATPAA